VVVSSKGAGAVIPVVTANMDEKFEALKEDLKPEKSSSGFGPSQPKAKSKTSRWSLSLPRSRNGRWAKSSWFNDYMVRRSG